LNYTGNDIALWTKTRKWWFDVVQASTTDMIVSAMILFNIIIMIYETDQRAKGDDVPAWAKTAGALLLIFYICELSVRLYVFRKNFFMSSYNVLDFVIVGTDVVFEMLGPIVGDMPDVTILRIARVLRALRFVKAVRSLVFFRELYMIMNGFFSAMKAIIWATVLLFVVLMLFSVVAVELINPLAEDMVKNGEFEDCERCGRAYSSTMSAMLTFTQQIVAGDEWGASSIPIIEKHPWTAIFFSAVLVCVDLGLMNLILSVIVDKAQQAHSDDLKFQVQEKEEEFQKLKKQLLRICGQLDEDESGCLTLDELLTGFDTSPEFHVALSSMDVQREDISSLFNILDDDGSGHVEYDEFVDQLHKMKTQDTHVVLVFIRGHVKEIKGMMAVQATQLATVEDRLQNYEKRTEDIIGLLTDLKTKDFAESADFSAAQETNEPQIFYNYSAQKQGGCFDACSPKNEQKSQSYRASPAVPQPNKSAEEVKALRAEIAGLDASLKSILDAQSAGPSGQPPTLPRPLAQLASDRPAASGSCCTPNNQMQEELNMKGLPANDMIVLPPWVEAKGAKGRKGGVGPMGLGKGGKGVGLMGKGRGGGRV